MPELPEVEVVRRGLAHHLPGRTFTGYWSSGKALRRNTADDQVRQLLLGARVAAIRRRAKYLLIDFNNQALLVLHLGMTGRLGIFPAASPVLAHDHLCWLLDNGRELRFNDTRRFGSVMLFPRREGADPESLLFADTGPEPLGPQLSASYLLARAKGRTMPVKQFLMDGRVVAGIGNIYANESLFAAGISPARPVGAIGRRRWQRLIDQLRDILDQAIACGGSTISDFFGTTGQGGYFQVHFSVYGKAGSPCPRCRAPIQSFKLGGRATFFCRRCQR
jgi:formamidopyrimidine-DNA glycosylase